MLVMAFVFAYLCGFSFIFGLMPMKTESRPTLETFGLGGDSSKKQKKGFPLFKMAAKANIPLCRGNLGQRITRDLTVAHVHITPEEFFLIKEIAAVVFLFVSYPSVTADSVFVWVLFCLVGGYMAPEIWLKIRIKKTKEELVKHLPDSIDLLGLCVNAGLDFMLALKWVVEKSPPSIMIDELNIVLQEINVGKTRRDAIKDLADRYSLPDLSTFARTLIQADKMGTSVTEALNILSEDMRIARYRRGEQLALKSPMKMLLPLLIFIFPVVGVLVAGPIMLDFMTNNPFETIGGG